MRNQNVVYPLLFLSLARFQLIDRSFLEFRHKTWSFLYRGYKRIEISSVPFRHRAIRVDIMRFLQIEQQHFIPRSNDFITPATRFRLPTNFMPKDSQCVAMIAIAANCLPGY